MGRMALFLSISGEICRSLIRLMTCLGVLVLVSKVQYFKSAADTKASCTATCALFKSLDDTLMFSLLFFRIKIRRLNYGLAVFSHTVRGK